MNRGSTNRTLSAHQFGKKNFDVTERAVTHLDPISGLIEQFNVLFYFLAHWVLRFKLHCHAFHFSWKVAPPRGTWLRMHHWLKVRKEERKRREIERKAQLLPAVGIKPGTSRFVVRCATTWATTTALSRATWKLSYEWESRAFFKDGPFPASFLYFCLCNWTIGR